METLVDTNRKKGNGVLARFQPPNATQSSDQTRIFSKPPIPRQVEMLQAAELDNAVIPRAKSDSCVTGSHGDGVVVLRRRSATSQVTADLLEQRRQSRLSRVASGMFDIGRINKRNSIASMESGCSNVPLEQNEREWIVKSALGDCDTISRLLLTDRNLVTYRDFISGYTGLHWSCKLARIDMSRVLIEGGSDVNARSHSGQTPLHLAAQTGKGEVIDLLLRSGADKEMRDHKGRKPGQYLPAGAGPETRSLLTLPQPPLNLETNPALRKFSKAMSVNDMSDNTPKRGQTMHQAWKKYKQSFVGKKKRGDHSMKVETTKRDSVTNRLDHHGNKDKVRTMPSNKQTAVFLSS